jgi:ubiquinone/menaquinone biosynthesis C-methylase UbiE
MSNKIEEEYHHSKFAFRIISLMHDNPLLPYFRNPQRLLKAAGLKPGQKVLEVGCGPGFFTIPKIEREKIKNIKPILTNASNIGLPDQSIDLAFIFGLLHVAGGLDEVISEIHRILKQDGVLSFEKTRGSKKKLIEDVERGGFIYSGRQARIFLFTKK